MGESSPESIAKRLLGASVGWKQRWVESAFGGDEKARDASRPPRLVVVFAKQISAPKLRIFAESKHDAVAFMPCDHGGARFHQTNATKSSFP